MIDMSIAVKNNHLKWSSMLNLIQVYIFCCIMHITLLHTKKRWKLGPNTKTQKLHNVTWQLGPKNGCPGIRPQGEGGFKDMSNLIWHSDTQKGPVKKRLAVNDNLFFFCSWWFDHQCELMLLSRDPPPTSSVPCTWPRHQRLSHSL